MGIINIKFRRIATSVEGGIWEKRHPETLVIAGEKNVSFQYTKAKSIKLQAKKEEKGHPHGSVNERSLKQYQKCFKKQSQ